MNLPLFIFGSMFFLLDEYVNKFRKDDKALTLEELKADLNFPKIQTFNFIIVGGGTAGCHLAGRLSNTYSVLLLEKGGYPVPAVETLFIREYALLGHTELNDFFYSVEQMEFARENNGIAVSAVGVMLGGSGSHNGMGYHRGFPQDFDEYARKVKDSSWSYANVEEHFKSIENFIGSLRNEGWRERYGSDGPMTVDTQVSEILPAWEQVAHEMGYKFSDPFSNETEGFLPFLKVARNGERVSTYTAYVRRHEGSDRRLTVLKYSEAEKILTKLDSDGKPYAYGVAYRRHGIPQIAHASKEVIISAGAFASPILLMKSGIGPEETLKEAKIPVVANVPGVGQNLREHTAVIMGFTATKPNRTLMRRVEETDFEDEITKYQTSPFRSGFFSTVGGGPHAFFDSEQAKGRNENDWPDLQITFEMYPYELVVHDCETCQKFNLYVALNRLESFGQLTFNVSNYLAGNHSTPELAIVDYRLFTDERDVLAMVEGLNLAYKIVNDTTPFQDMGATYTDDKPDACEASEIGTDEYWRCLIRGRAMVWNHITGTCKMGNEDDGAAVVDSKLRVKGVKKLRVADASVLPTPTGANINAAVMLVAEKTADQIFSDYGTRGTEGSRNTAPFNVPTTFLMLTMLFALFLG